MVGYGPAQPVHQAWHDASVGVAAVAATAAAVVGGRRGLKKQKSMDDLILKKKGLSKLFVEKSPTKVIFQPTFSSSVEYFYAQKQEK